MSFPIVCLVFRNSIGDLTLAFPTLRHASEMGMHILPADSSSLDSNFDLTFSNTVAITNVHSRALYICNRSSFAMQMIINILKSCSRIIFCRAIFYIH